MPSFLTQAALLGLLRRRYEPADIYTFTSDMVVSVNPYATIPDLYDMEKFNKALATAKERKQRLPHLYTVANKAYKQVTSPSRLTTTTSQPAAL